MFEISYSQQIISKSENGAWVLTLPPSLKSHEAELESLLAKVFSGKPNTARNLALAQQLSLNWCASVARKEGISLEDCLS